MALCRGRHRPRPHRRHPRRRRHRHPPLAPAHRGRRPEGAAPRPRARRPHRPRHRLPPEPLGPRRPRRRRGALHRERRRHRQAAVHAAPLRPDRRHRGGVPHRRRLDRHPRRAPRRPRRLRRHPRLQARRRWAPPPSPARSPTASTTARRGPGFPIEVFNVLGAGDGFMSGLLKGWLTDQDWPTALEVRQRLRRLRRLAPRLHPGLSVLGGARSSSSTAASAPPRCARTPSSSRSTGRPTASRDWPEMRVFAFDHRMQLEEIADELGHAARPHRRLQAALPRRPRARSPPAAPATASSATAASAATRSTPPPAPASGSAARSSGPGTRPLPLELEIEPDYGSALAEWPLEHVVKVLCFYHPDDAPAMRADQEATVARLCPRRPRQPARVPARDHPVEGRRRSRDTTAPRSSSASTTSASTPTGGSSSR